MTTVYDVGADELIKSVAADLKMNIKLVKPEWSMFVKTGNHKERVPENKEWWYIRAASVLRKVYIGGPVGVQRLRTVYGGRKNRGVKPEKFVRAGGKILRTILKELDKTGFTQKEQTGKGRIITPKGQAYLDTIATKIVYDKG